MRYTPRQVEYLKAKGAPEIAEMVKPESPFLWQAFHILRSGRNFGGQIMPSEMFKYLEAYNITCPVQKHQFVRMMVTLDNAESDLRNDSSNT